MTTRLCNTCNTTKELELFPIQKMGKYGRNAQCKACVSIRNKARYDSKKEEICKQVKEYRAVNRDRVLIAKREYAKKAYRKNRPQRNAITRQYQANKIKRTPKWLSKEQKLDIQKFYEEAHRLTESLGSRYVVDHIVPLQGKTVSGLHVPWNLQILSKEDNSSKSNIFLPS
jgi:hypothetical protein